MTVRLATTPPWWVYMVATRKGRLYTGITTDVERRFAEHREGARRGAKFFRSDAAEAVVYREGLGSRSEASRRESVIKKLTRAQKLALIASMTEGLVPERECDDRLESAVGSQLGE